MLRALSELDKDLHSPRGRKRRPKADDVDKGGQPDGGGRRRKGPRPTEGGRWFGQQAHRVGRRSSSSASQSTRAGEDSEIPATKRWRKKDKVRTPTNSGRASDRGPFGAGRKVTHDDNIEVSSDSSDEGSVFREGPSSVGGGKSLQIQLREYSQKHPGRLAARLLHGFEGGGPVSPTTTSMPPVATNWVLTVLMPLHKALTGRQIREMRMLDMTLDLYSRARPLQRSGLSSAEAQSVGVEHERRGLEQGPVRGTFGSGGPHTSAQGRR